MSYLDGIINIYSQGVEEADKKNTAELYKNAFLYVKKLFKDEYHKEIIDEEYLDGYFIFGTGTNSVVHFKIDGCKNWLFGIWWSYKEDKLSGECFCQHEKYLDKFRPSNGIYNCDIHFTTKDNVIEENECEYGVYRLSKIADFIHRYPYVAAMKGLHGYDYNIYPQKPIWCFFKYYQITISEFIQKKISNFCNNSLKRYLSKTAAQDLQGFNWEVKDYGDSWFPRYELQVKLDDNDDRLEPGFYNFFEFNEVVSKQKWEKKVNKLKKFAKFFGCYWTGNDVSDFINIWKENTDE